MRQIRLVIELPNRSDALVRFYSTRARSIEALQRRVTYGFSVWPHATRIEAEYVDPITKEILR